MIVISDLLDMFVRDPQIEANEARYLINEIANSITKSRVLEDVLVIVSFSFVGSARHRNNTPAVSYNDKTILPRFDKCIKIMNSHENRNKMIFIYGLTLRFSNRSVFARVMWNIDEFLHERIQSTISVTKLHVGSDICHLINQSY